MVEGKMGGPGGALKTLNDFKRKSRFVPCAQKITLTQRANTIYYKRIY